MLIQDNTIEVNIGNGFSSQIAHLTCGDIHYVKGGTGKLTVVFLHGFSQDWYEFRELMQRMVAEYTVIAIDLPGIGLSTNAARKYTAQALAEMLQLFCQTNDLQRPYIVAHDMGGMIAYAFARLYPNNITGVALLDAPLPGTLATDILVKMPFMWHFIFHRLPFLPEKIISGRVHTYFKRAFYRRFMKHKDAFSDTVMQHYASAYESPRQLEAGLGLYRAYRTDRCFTQSHRESCQVPIIILEGDYGSTRPGPTANQLRKTFGCSAVDAQIIKGCGHFMSEEDPDTIAAQIRKHIANSVG